MTLHDNNEESTESNQPSCSNPDILLDGAPDINENNFDRVRPQFILMVLRDTRVPYRDLCELECLNYNTFSHYYFIWQLKLERFPDDIEVFSENETFNTCCCKNCKIVDSSSTFSSSSYSSSSCPCSSCCSETDTESDQIRRPLNYTSPLHNTEGNVFDYNNNDDEVNENDSSINVSNNNNNNNINSVIENENDQRSYYADDENNGESSNLSDSDSETLCDDDWDLYYPPARPLSPESRARYLSLTSRNL